MNIITLTGNSVKEIEVKQTNNGKAVANGTIAVRRDFKNANGEYESDFINFVAYGAQGELIAKYVNKGNHFAITGRLQIRKYEKDGQTRYITEVIVNGFDFPSKRSGNDSNTNTPTRRNEAPSGQNKPSDDVFSGIGDIDSELPF